MSQEPVLEWAGNVLLDLLKEAIGRGVLQSEDDIQLTYPNGARDCRVGVFLYDMEEVRPYGTPPPVRTGETQRRGPDRAFALHFLVYANRKVPFDSMTALDELLLLEAAMRAVHSCPPVRLEGEPVSIRFDSLTLQEKTALWQSLGSPLQPAVYLVLEPLVIPSDRLERLYPVRQLQLHIRRKTEGPPPQAARPGAPEFIKEKEGF